MKELTGSIVQKLNIDDGDLMERIETALENDWTIMAVPSARIDDIGMSNEYNLGVVNVGRNGQLELRNSWGSKS